MTADEIVKSIFGAVLAAIAAAVSWLTSQVIKNKEALALQGARMTNVEKQQEEHLKKGEREISDLRKEIEKVEEKALTTECVREVVEEALEKRDRIEETRRHEWGRTLKLEIRETVREELKEAARRITPVRGHKRPSDVGETG